MDEVSLVLEFSGHIKGKEGYSDENDLNILSLLNNNKSEISSRIEKRIKENLGKFVSIRNVKVDIIFEKGSILASGLIVIQFLGVISGAISFFEYFGKLIKMLTENEIRETIQNQNYTVSIQLNQIPNDTANRVSVNYLPNNTNSLQPSILRYLTILNIVILILSLASNFTLIYFLIELIRC